MTYSIIVIKGNMLMKIEDIFKEFNYFDLAKDKHFTNWEEFMKVMDKDDLVLSKKQIGVRGIWFDHAYTIIFDPSLLDSMEEKVLSTISTKLNTELYTFIIQTTSGVYGFTKYDKVITRKFECIAGKIHTNLGSALEEEENLNFNSSIFVDDILNLARKLNIDVDGTKTTDLIIKQISYSENSKELYEGYRVETPKVKENKKPWWKFW